MYMAVRSDGSVTSGSFKEKPMTVEDIRQQFFQEAPAEVLDQVPQDTWDRIFGELDSFLTSHGGSEDDARIKGAILRKLGSKMQKEFEGELFLEDCYSVISEISLGAITGDDVTKGTRAMRRRIQRHSIQEEGSEEAQHHDQHRMYLEQSLASCIDENLKEFEAAHYQPQQHHPKKIKPKKKHDRSVKFDQVQFRLYERTLSDNPSVSIGPAIGLDWTYVAPNHVITVDEWEVVRNTSQPRAPSPRYLIVPRFERMSLVKGCGVSQREIADNTRAIRRDQRRRVQTIQNIGVDDFVDRTGRRLKRILSFGRRKKKSSLAAR